MDYKNPFGLPDKVSANIKIGKTGRFLISFPELDTFTECERKEDIDDFVNDLLHCYFDIPKKIRRGIKFTKIDSPALALTRKDGLGYRFFMSPEIVRSYLP